MLDELYAPDGPMIATVRLNTYWCAVVVAFGAAAVVAGGVLLGHTGTDTPASPPEQSQVLEQ